MNLLNHVPALLCQEHSMCPHSSNHLQHHSTKNTMIPYMAQSWYPLNSQVLAIFFPFATIPAMPHYPVFINRYSPQCVMLTFLLLFITKHIFMTSLPPQLPPRFSIIQSVQSCARHHPWPLWQNFSDPTPIFLQPCTWFRLCRSSKDNVPG